MADDRKCGERNMFEVLGSEGFSGKAYRSASLKKFSHLADPRELRKFVSAERNLIISSENGRRAFALMKPWRTCMNAASLNIVRWDQSDSKEFVDFVVARALERGYKSVVVRTEIVQVANKLEEMGFRLRERLIVMAADRDGIKKASKGKSSLRLKMRDYRNNMEAEVLCIDRESFDSFWLLEVDDILAIASSLPRNRFRVAYHEEKVCGYSIGGSSYGWGCVQRLAVDPAFRGKGVAKKMLGDLIKWMALHKARYVLVNTQESNLHARNLYCSCGFKVLNENQTILEMDISKNAIN